MGPSRGASSKIVCKYPLEPGLSACGHHRRDTQKKNYKVSLLTTDPSSSYRNDAADSSSDVSPSS